MLQRNPRVCTLGSVSPQNALFRGFLGGLFSKYIVKLKEGCYLPRLLSRGPRRGKLLDFSSSFPPPLVRTCGAGCESVSLPGTLCLELVDIALVRQLLSENGNLSKLKLFMGGGWFQ